MCIIPGFNDGSEDADLERLIIRARDEHGWSEERIRGFTKRVLERAEARRSAAHEATLASITPEQWRAIADEAAVRTRQSPSDFLKPRAS